MQVLSVRGAKNSVSGLSAVVQTHGEDGPDGHRVLRTADSETFFTSCARPKLGLRAGPATPHRNRAYGHETSPQRGCCSPVRCLDRRPQAQGAPNTTARPQKRPKSAGSSHEWSWLSLLRPRDASIEIAWGQRRCVRDPAFTSRPKEPCSQRASRSGTVLPTRTVDGCGRPRRSNCSCDPFWGRALPRLRAARRRCFGEYDDPAADGALRADGTRDFKK